MFERLSIFIIVANCATLALEDPLDKANSGWRNTVVLTSEPYFTALFTLEMLLRVRRDACVALAAEGPDCTVGLVSMGCLCVTHARRDRAVPVPLFPASY